MSRREQLEPWINDPLSTAPQIVRDELRLLWAKDDADASLQRLLAMSPWDACEISKAKEAKWKAREAYEADNE